jgi:hypothetical protein
MPMVGMKKFSYGKKGEMAASTEAKKTGKPVKKKKKAAKAKKK